MITIESIAQTLASLGFNIKPDATSLGYGHHYNIDESTVIFVRPPRGYRWSWETPSVIFEMNPRTGTRGKRYSDVPELKVRSADSLEAQFKKWLAENLCYAKMAEAKRADLREMNRLARAAVRNYAEAVGVDPFRVTTDAKGMPVGIKIEVTISGTPEEALRKHSALRKLPEILALLERTQARLQGESLPLPVRIRQEISDLLTSLNK